MRFSELLGLSRQLLAQRSAVPPRSLSSGR